MKFLESKALFIWIVILGLIGVGFSYYVGLGSMPNGAADLWGNAPDYIKPLYPITTALAFLGFSLFFFFLVFKTDLMTYYPFSRSALVILVASMLWLPYTSEMIAYPTTFTWVKIRLSLLIVGMASAFLLRRTYRLTDDNYGIWYKLALGGTGVFLFHTLVMDALIWPHFF